MWGLLSGTVLGLGAALIVSKSDSLRRRRDAASFVRLKLEAWINDIDWIVAMFGKTDDPAKEKQTLARMGFYLESDRPRMGSLLESRIAELIGFHENLDLNLTGFHESVMAAEIEFADFSPKDWEESEEPDNCAKMNLRFGARSMLQATKAAVRARLYFEDLFSAGWEARRNRLAVTIGQYKGPSEEKWAEVAELLSALTMDALLKQEEKSDDESGESKD